MGPQWRHVPHSPPPPEHIFFLKLGENISRQTFNSNLKMEFHVCLLERIHIERDLTRKESCNVVQQALIVLKWNHPWKEAMDESVSPRISHGTIWKYTQTVSQKEQPSIRTEIMLYVFIAYAIFYFECMIYRTMIKILESLDHRLFFKRYGKQQSMGREPFA